MNKHLLITLITLFSFQSLFAQLPSGSIAPDFELTDLNGNTHRLYDYTDQGYTVFIDFSAVWCGPCWGYHQTGALEDLYVNHGPSGHPHVSATTTDDVMVIFVEGDGSSETCIGGTGCGTQGDWITGTQFPIICTDGTVNTTSVVADYQIGYWPTVYQVCPDRTLTECGTNGSPYSLVTACLPPPSQNNDARSFMNNSANSGCSSVSPEITVQNYGLNNLTEIKVDVSVNGVFQYSSIINQYWDNTTMQFEYLNLNTLEIHNIELDPITDLVNGDVIAIDVSLPNGVTDTDPSNNGTISYIVDLGFDNAYWDGLLSIDVSGNASNSWYLKQVSNNLIIASGFGGVTGVSNSFPLEFNECYTLQSIDGSGQTYTVTDAVGNIVLDGSVNMIEEFDNFTTGNEVWTGIDNQEMTSISVYPSPAKDKLYVEGEYDYLRIIDLLGKEILYSRYAESIDVSSLNNGLYLLEIISSDRRYAQKIQIDK